MLPDLESAINRQGKRAKSFNQIEKKPVNSINKDIHIYLKKQKRKEKEKENQHFSLIFNKVIH